MRFEPFDWSAHYKWANQRLPLSWTQDTKGIVAVEGSKPRGCVLLNNWTYTGCFGHLMADTPMVWRHGLHQEAFRYVFDTCGKKYMFGMTQSDNPKALRLVKHFGFEEIYRLPDGYDEGVDLVIMRATREVLNG